MYDFMTSQLDIDVLYFVIVYINVEYRTYNPINNGETRNQIKII